MIPQQVKDLLSTMMSPITNLLPQRYSNIPLDDEWLMDKIGVDNEEIYFERMEKSGMSSENDDSEDLFFSVEDGKESSSGDGVVEKESFESFGSEDSSSEDDERGKRIVIDHSKSEVDGYEISPMTRKTLKAKFPEHASSPVVRRVDFKGTLSELYGKVDVSQRSTEKDNDVVSQKTIVKTGKYSKSPRVGSSDYSFTMFNKTKNGINHSSESEIPTRDIFKDTKYSPRAGIAEYDSKKLSALDKIDFSDDIIQIDNSKAESKYRNLRTARKLVESVPGIISPKARRGSVDLFQKPQRSNSKVFKKPNALGSLQVNEVTKKQRVDTPVPSKDENNIRRHIDLSGIKVKKILNLFDDIESAEQKQRHNLPKIAVEEQSERRKRFFDDIQTPEEYFNTNTPTKKSRIESNRVRSPDYRAQLSTTLPSPFKRSTIFDEIENSLRTNY